MTTMLRYDERGFGMSDWTVDDFSLAARLSDLETVVDAAGLDRFVLMGMSGGSAPAMAYAIAHPERISRLILYGTVCGDPVVWTADEQPVEDTYRSMIRVGWAKPDPEFRRVFTRWFIPGATEEQMRWFDDLQRMSTSPENAPTLILQAPGDRSTTFDNAVRVSGQIRGSRLVALDSRNHILLAGEPAWATFVDEVAAFIEPERRR